eukprot:GHVT01033990.1.p3 GENE.GHVT01033990.1~~GHVT01033990.1.p3  ORF type:complete len:103 (-),score=33.53 GHVT01033990.1:855-1163(-)
MEQTMSFSSYSVAWLHEELGDLMSNRVNRMILDSDAAIEPLPSPALRGVIAREYELAALLLLILCGDRHSYTVAALNKQTRVETLDSVEEVEDLQQSQQAAE